MQRKRIFIVSALIVIALIVACFLAMPVQALSERTQVFYYVWYSAPGTDGWWSHWGQYMHCPWDYDLGSAYYPELGPYSSRDPAAIRQHMKWLKDAGVGVILLSWWGQSSLENKICSQVLDIAGEFGIKCAWMMEPAETPAQMKNDLIYVIDNYSSRSSFYRDAGKGNRPVFYIWAMGTWPASDWATQWDSIRGTGYDSIVMANSFDHNTVLNGHWDGFYNYHRGQDAANWPSHASWAQANNKIFAPPVGPGWDNTAIEPPGVGSVELRYDGATYDSDWSAAYNVAVSYSSVRYICVPTFNEWHEGTQIEPAIPVTTSGRTYPDYSPNVSTLYIDKTTSWTAAFDPATSGIVQCEDYSGGTGAQEGVDYHDTTAGNSGGQYRAQNVDIETCGEGRYDIGYVAPGEWLRYTGVQVAISGAQQIRLRAAAWSTGKTVRVCEGSLGVTILTLSIPDTGGGQKWRTVSGQVSLSQGAHTIYLVMDQGDVNLNWFDIRAVTDTTPTAAVTNLAAVSSDGENALSWTNPSSADFSRTIIRCKTDDYPLSPNDGTLVCNRTASPGSNDSFTHAGLANNTIYYYAAFAIDTTGNSAAGCTALQMPSSLYCFRDAFPYANGALVGQGGWTGTATASHIEVINQMVRFWGGSGSKTAIKTVNCGDSGPGYIWVRCKIYRGSGANTCWNLWINDAAGKNLARWYGSGATARGRIGTTSSVTATQTLTGGWDNIDVNIYPATNNTEFFFNGTSIGTLSHASQGAGDAVGQLKIERENNGSANGEFVYLDDIRIGDPVTDTTAPGTVGGFSANLNHGSEITLAWTNPADADFVKTVVRYRTDTYPTSPTDGTLFYTGRETIRDHVNLNLAKTYYYSAWAYDEAGNYSAAATSSATPYYFRDTFPYSNGELNNKGIWHGSAGAAQIDVAAGVVRIWGDAGNYDAIRGVYFTDPGTGVMWVRCKIMAGVGGRTIWSLWINDGLGRNLARWYGTGWSARGRIGITADVTPQMTLTGGWDTIDVKINPYANTSEFFFNGVSIGALSHASQGAGDAIEQLRFERIDNWEAVTHYVQLDDLRVGGF